MTDPISNLVHDHGELNARVLAIGDQLRAHGAATSHPDATAERDGASALEDELWKALVELRDLLFLHFAREEEGVFPFIAEIAPDLAPQVSRMETAHDTICGAVARLCHLAESDGAAATMLGLFERFQLVYAEHAQAEAALLAALDRRLDSRQRARLAALVAGI